MLRSSLKTTPSKRNRSRSTSLIQTGETRWDFYYVADESANHRDIEISLARLLGAGVRVNAFRKKFIAPAASGKFALLKPLAK